MPAYPHVALLVSGGHTHLLRVNGPGDIRLLGASRDDAAGEAFDKTAKLLGLGYPGGIQIDERAKEGNPEAFQFPRALPGRDDLDFSFSGLKTAVSRTLSRYHQRNIGETPANGAAGAAAMPDTVMADFCASFQQAVVDVLVRKTRRALVQENLSQLVMCGGVAANSGLRVAMQQAAASDGFELFVPPPRYCTDNAVMIAAAGSALLTSGKTSDITLAVDPGLPL